MAEGLAERTQAAGGFIPDGFDQRFADELTTILAAATRYARGQFGAGHRFLVDNSLPTSNAYGSEVLVLLHSAAGLAYHPDADLLELAEHVRTGNYSALVQPELYPNGRTMLRVPVPSEMAR